VQQRGIEGMREVDRHDVEVLILRVQILAVAHPPHVIAPGDQALREQEPRRELEVATGRAHRHGDRDGLLARTGHADLHRLLGDEPV
jgi:hypothetical protein